LRGFLHPVKQIAGYCDIGVRNQLDVDPLVHVEIKIHLNAVVLVNFVGDCVLDRLKSVLATNYLQRMRWVEVFRVLRNYIAEGPALAGIILHLQKSGMVQADFSVSAVVGLIFRVQWRVDRCQTG